MQVGDLVMHKRTQAFGLILCIDNEAEYSLDWYDVKWHDGCNNMPGSHLKGELVAANESR